MKWRWYHGVFFYVGVEAVAFGLAQLAKSAAGKSDHGPVTLPAGEEKTLPVEPANPQDKYSAFYNSLIQPVFAPPAPIFLPAWTVNNVLTIAGLLRVLNLPKETPGLRAYLESLTVFYLTYISFNGVYFSLRSPIGGAVLTNIGFAAALRCGYIALTQLKDKKVALSLSTLVPWLTVASVTATTIAAWNRDSLLGAGPLVTPSRRWRKNS